MVGVLWASASQGVSVKELRAAIGLYRERLESAYEFLLEHPPLGLLVQRHGEEFSLVTAPEVAHAWRDRLGEDAAQVVALRHIPMFRRDLTGVFAPIPYTA